MNENCSILIDPSNAGDAEKNAELRKNSCETCGFPHARGGAFCARCIAKSRLAHEARIRSFNQFMFGCDDPIHVHNVGWLNPHDRSSRQYLDD